MSSECSDGALSWRRCVLSVSISDYICLLAGLFLFHVFVHMPVFVFAPTFTHQTFIDTCCVPGLVLGAGVWGSG